MFLPREFRASSLIYETREPVGIPWSLIRIGEKFRGSAGTLPPKVVKREILPGDRASCSSPSVSCAPRIVLRFPLTGN